ncbi:hypothetical protein [Bosea sp. Root381]|uniref:hypothetical protein n=1 Tax=Bosea sp. Root381 TaxID=1736524 RepID=UPI000A5718C7|nr:hypothetical protein [Bosea sp. Root381]
MIEAVMLVVLGFLSASLLALAAVPALARRAERLARRRAEAAFPLSLAEIAADRDHLRAELALRARTLEQEAERGFAAKAAAMRELGGRDMRIGELDAALRERAIEIAALNGDLEAAREQLAESRAALTGTGGDLAAREAELGRERDALGRGQALLAERDAELAKLREEHDQLRVALVEGRTRIMVLETRGRDLSESEARQAMEREQAKAEAALAAERLSQQANDLRKELEAREAQLQAARAEIQTLQGALEESRTERSRLKRETAQARKAGGVAAVPDPAAQAALRREIMAVAERLMALPPKQEAAE